MKKPQAMPVLNLPITSISKDSADLENPMRKAPRTASILNINIIKIM